MDLLTKNMEEDYQAFMAKALELAVSVKQKVDRDEFPKPDEIYLRIRDQKYSEDGFVAYYVMSGTTKESELRAKFGGSHYLKVFYRSLLYAYPKHGDNILLRSDLPTLRTIVKKHNLITDFDTYDKLAKDYKNPASAWSVIFCRYETLLDIKNHPDKEAREIVYQRLGAADSYGDQLNDKSQDIRANGVIKTPLHDEALTKMVTDPGSKVYEELVNRISDKDLLFCLGSKHLKDSNISRDLQWRMSMVKYK